MNRLFSIATCALWILQGCTKIEPQSGNECQQHIQQCYRMRPHIAFYGFDTSQLSTIILHRFTYTNTFSTKIDSRELTYTASTEASNYEYFPIYISDSFDYRIEVPAADTSYNIHSDPIPQSVDTIECYSRQDQYGIPCVSSANVWVNETEGFIHQTGPTTIRLVLKK